MSRSSRRAFIGTLGAAAVALPEIGPSTLGIAADRPAQASAAAQAGSCDQSIVGGTVTRVEPIGSR